MSVLEEVVEYVATEDGKPNVTIKLNLKKEDVGDLPLTNGLKDVENRMKVFLLGYIRYGVIGTACNLAGVKRRHFNDWRKYVPKFKEIFDEMEEQYTDILEQEANRRALEKSDSLLQFMLRARRPEKFNPTQMIKADLGDSGVRIVFSDSELSESEKKLLMENDIPVEGEE